MSPAIRSNKTNDKLLQIHPTELQFPFILKNQASCAMKLINNSSSYVAFKVKTTNAKRYCVRPNNGVISPRSSCHVTVTMQAQKDYPSDMQCCKDKFLIQSSVGVTAKDKMLNKESGNRAEECKLRVSYFSPREKACASTTSQTSRITQTKKGVEGKPSSVQADIQSSSARTKKSIQSSSARTKKSSFSRSMKVWGCVFTFRASVRYVSD